MASTDIDFQPAQPKKNGLAAKWNGFRTFCYNPDGGTFCGRTCSSWFKITAFYLVYYSILAGFSVAMMAIFFTTLDNDQPKQQGMQSLIKGNPGLAFRPMPNTESTLIKFNSGDEPSFKKYKEAIDTFLDAYDSDTVDKEGETIPCPAGYVRPEGETRPCKFDIAQLGNWCTKTNNYGFFEGQPCVILKLNKVFGWSPEPYNETDSVPAEVQGKLIPGYLPITCEGEQNSDIDAIGAVEFYPPGFPLAYFPYENQPGFRTPVVMVRFTRPVPGTLIQVWCKVWAKNIYHHKNDKAGSSRFEILVN